MRSSRVIELARRIEENEMALSWLEQYGIQLTGHSEKGEAVFSISLTFAGSCYGAEEAKDSLCGYARASLPDIVQMAIRGCKNTIAIDKDEIKKELGE